MGLEQDITILSEAPLLGLLDRDALRLLAFAAETRTLRAGSILFRKGDRSDGAYVVVRGVIVLDRGEAGVLEAEAGALIGRTALFVRGRRPATAHAPGPATVMRVSPSLMRRVLEEFPQAAETLRAAMAGDLLALSQGLAAVRTRLDALDRGALNRTAPKA